jgi:Fe-S cluster assembly protein SufD
MNAQLQKPPSNRDEHWKYANLRSLARLRAQAAAEPSREIIERTAAILPARLPHTSRVVLIDGFLVDTLSDALRHDSVPGLMVQTRLSQDRSDIARAADRYFADLNAEGRGHRLQISLAADSKARLEILCIATIDAHPAIAVDLATGAALTLIERHLPLEITTTAITNLYWQGRIGPHGSLDLARIGHHGPKSHFIETLELTLDEGASAKVVQITEGAASSRATAYVTHAGRDATLDWQTAALGEATQTHDTFVHVAHESPGARTHQIFRGIAAGRSRIAFNGHMRVAAAAIGADSAQSLKGLIAGAEAEVDVRPQLEIYTDAVKASHGATVGKLDADMLFYLLSRGIDPESAESLLKWAFVSDVLARLPCSVLRAQVEAILERQLPGAAAARAGA